MTGAARRAANEGPSTAHTEISQPGYVDATSWLRETCARLGPAQMVHGPHFSLLDSMGAIQAMEPRMDSGIYPLPDDLVADSDRLPEGMGSAGRFSPFDELDVKDLCWIMDRALASEVAWHRGGTLSQTLCTCLLAHQLAALRSRLTSLLDPAMASASTSRHVPPLTRHVLIPYLVGLLKSVGLAWDELIRGNVVDGEDFSSDPAGLDLQASLDPDEALAQIEEAIRWVQVELSGDEPGRDALIARLSLRRSILLCLSRLTLYSIRAHRGSHDLSSQVAMLRSSLSLFATSGAPGSSVGLRDPSLRSAPSAAALRSFDPHFSRRIASAGGSGSGMPPPKPVQLGQPDETLRFYADLADGLGMAVTLLERPSWTEWKRSIVEFAVHFQARQTPAYIRSMVQSIVYQERGCVFSLESLDWIAESFLLDVVGVPIQLLAMAAESPNVESGTGAQFSYFSERLASQLVNFLCALSQNRARGKRVLGKLYTSSVALSEDGSQLGRRLSEVLPSMHPDLLFASLQHLSLSIVYLTLCANFELSLLSRSEWAQSYWLLARVAREQLAVLTDLRNEVGEGRLEEDLTRAGLGAWRGRGKQRAQAYLDAEIAETRIALTASEAYRKLLVALDRTEPQRSWPCTLEDMEAAESLSKGLSVPLNRARHPAARAPPSDDMEAAALAAEKAQATGERRQALRREIWCKRTKWLVSVSSSASRGSGGGGDWHVKRDKEEALLLWEEYRREEKASEGLETSELIREAKEAFEKAGRARVARRAMTMTLRSSDGERAREHEEEEDREDELERLFELNAKGCQRLLDSSTSQGRDRTEVASVDDRDEGLADELERTAKATATETARARLDFDDARAHPWYPVLHIGQGAAAAAAAAGTTTDASIRSI